MTLDELKDLCAFYTSDPDFGYVTEARWLVLLNQSVYHIQRYLLNASEDYYTKCVTADTVSDQQNYTLPSDFMKVQGLNVITSGSGVNAAKQPIDPISRGERGFFPQNTGTPKAYWLNEDQLILSPIPDSVKALELDYSRRVEEMSDDSDVPDCPKQYHQYCAIRAAYEALATDGRSAENTYLLELKKDFEDQMSKDMEQRTQDAPRGVVSTEGGFGSY